MWFDLDKSQREKFEKQARQLSQISLPPSPQKGKPEVKVQGLYYGEKSTSKEKVKSKNKERKSSKSNGKSFLIRNSAERLHLLDSLLESLLALHSLFACIDFLKKLGVFLENLHSCSLGNFPRNAKMEI